MNNTAVFRAFSEYVNAPEITFIMYNCIYKDHSYVLQIGTTEILHDTEYFKVQATQSVTVNKFIYDYVIRQHQKSYTTCAYNTCALISKLLNSQCFNYISSNELMLLRHNSNSSSFVLKSSCEPSANSSPSAIINFNNIINGLIDYTINDIVINETCEDKNSKKSSEICHIGTFVK